MANSDALDSPNWYLQEWMAHFGKIQADLSKELGWDKARANFHYHSKQQYRRDTVNELAQWLGIEPFELLIPPERALEIRDVFERLRLIATRGQEGVVINSETERFLDPSRPSRPRTRKAS